MTIITNVELKKKENIIVSDRIFQNRVQNERLHML